MIYNNRIPHYDATKKSTLNFYLTVALLVTSYMML